MEKGKYINFMVEEKEFPEEHYGALAGLSKV